MPTAVYTGTLADIGLGLLTSRVLSARVRPEVEAISPDGLISAVPVPFTVDPVTGAFTLNLIPSGALTPTKGGRAAGVDYIIELGRFQQELDGTHLDGIDVWQFTAVAGGGNIGEMNGGSVLSVWVGPPWPPLPSPRGLYIDLTPPNAWGVKE